MQKRKLKHIPTLNDKSGSNITTNFYPVTSAITLFDEKTKLQLLVLNDRSQAGSAIVDGRIELM